MATKYFPNQNALGRRLDFRTSQPPQWTTIVGVVGDVKDRPDSASAEPAFWWPVTQTPMRFGQMAIVVRGAADPSQLANQVRAAVRKLDPGLAVANIRTMDEIAGSSFATHRFTLFLVGLFAALALALAAAGIYGVISYSVNQRVHEFAMRIALGARGWDVMRLVLGHGVRIAAAGVILGLASAAALARVMSTLLYEVSGTDPVTFAGVAVMAIAIAVFACYVPARRATSVDPMTALRAE
jgi:ABC-type lipoprotein release transport system permease subunit